MAIFDGNNNPIDSGMTPEQLKALVSQGLIQPVQMNMIEEKKQSDDIAKELKKVIENFDKVVEEAKKLVDDAKDAYKVKPIQQATGGDLTKGVVSPLLKQGQKELKLDSLANKYGHIASKQLGKLKFGSAQHVVLEGNKGAGKAIEDTNTDISHLLKALERENAKKSGGANPMMGAMGFQGHKPSQMMQQGTLSVLEGISLVDIFKGGIKQEYDFMKGMREIAYQTDAVAGSTESVQDKWTSLSKSVAETGVNRTVMQKALETATKKGIRSLGETNKVLKSGLFTSKQIGANAEQTADLFNDWHMHLGMSANQIDAMSGSMRSVARQTGVTGDNLLAAAKSTEQVMMNMRNTGMLTTSAAETFMKISAAAQKLGVGKEAEKFTSALTGGLHNFVNNTSSFMKTMIVRGADVGGIGGGDIGALTGGSVAKSPEKMAKLMGGINKSMSDLVGIQDLAHTDLSKFNDQQLDRMNQTIQMASGGEFQGASQLQRALQAMEEGTRPFAEQLKKLDDQFHASTSTTEERMNIERKRKDLMINESSKVLSAYDEQISKAGSLEKALKSGGLTKFIEENRAAIESTMKLKPGESKGMDTAKLMQGMAQVKLESLQGLSKASNIKMKIDSGQVQGLMKSGNPGKVREAIAMLEKENKRIATEEEARTDPVKAAQLKIMKLNEQIRIISAASMGYLFAIMGSTGLIAWWLTSVLGKQMLGTAFGIKNLISGAKSPAMGKMVARGAKTIGEHLTPDTNIAKAAEFVGIDLAKFGKRLKNVGEAAEKGEHGLMGTLKFLWKGGKAAAETGPSVAKVAASLESLAPAGMVAGGAIEGVAAAAETLAPAGMVAGGAIEGVAGATAVAGEAAVAAEVEVAGMASMFTGVGEIAALAALAVGVVGGGLWGIKSAFEAGDKAMFIFGKTQEQLTLNQIWAAESAGLLTGALNFLTFGIFRKALGPTGTLTKSLAHLFEAIPPLYWILEAFMMLVKVVVGVLYGLWKFVKNVFIGIWDALKIVLSSFDPIFDAIGAVVKIFTDAFADFGIKAEGTVGIIELISDVLGGLGTAIGWIIKAFAYLIKGVIYPFAIVIGWVVKVVGGAIAGMWSAIAPVINSLIKIFVGLANVISGIFTFDFKKIGRGFGQIISGILGAIINFIVGIPMFFINAFMGAFKQIGKIIKNSLKLIFVTIPAMAWDAIKATGKWFMELPGMIWDAFSSWATDLGSDLSEQFSYFFSTIPQMLKDAAIAVGKFFFVTLPLAVLKGIYEIGKFFFVTLPLAVLKGIYQIGKFILEGLWWGIKHLPEMIGWALLGVLAILVGIPALIMYGLYKVGKFLLVDLPLMALNGIYQIGKFFLVDLPLMALNGIYQIGKFLLVDLPLMALNGIKTIGNFFMGLPGYAWKGIKAIGTAIYDGFVGMVNWLVDGILKPFRWLYDVLIGHSIIPDLVFGIVKFFAMLPFKILGALAGLPLKIVGLLWEGFKNIGGLLFKGITGAITSVGKVIFNVFSSAFQSVASFVSGLFKGVFNLLKSPLKLFSKAAGWIGEKAGQVWDATKGVAGKAWETTKGVASKVGEKAGQVWDATKEVAGKFAGWFGDKFSKVWGAAKDVAGDLASKAAEKAGKLWNVVKDVVGKTAEKASGLVSQVWDATKGVAGKAAGWVGEKAGQVWDATKGVAGKAAGWAGEKAGQVWDATKGVAGKAAGWAGNMFTKGKGLIGGLFGQGAMSKVTSFVGSTFSKGAGVVSGLFGKVLGSKAGTGLLTKVGGSLLRKLPGIGAVLGVGAGIAALVKGDIGGAIKNVASGLLSTIPGIGTALSLAVDFLGDHVIDGAKWIGGKLYDGASWVGGKLADGASWLGGKLADGASWLGGKLADGASWLGEKLADGAKAVGNSAADLAESLNNASKPVTGGNKNVITGNTAWWQSDKSILADAKKQTAEINSQHDTATESAAWMSKNQDIVRRLRQENGLDPDTGNPIATPVPTPVQTSLVEDANKTLATDNKSVGVTTTDVAHEVNKALATQDTLGKSRPIAESISPATIDEYGKNADAIKTQAQTVMSNSIKLAEDMKREQVGAEPDLTEVSGEELTEIAKNSENLDLLQDILDAIKELKGEGGIPELTGEGGSMSPPMHTHKPSSPPNFYRLPGGSFNQGPSRQVANAGWH